MFHNEADIDLDIIRQLDYTCSSTTRHCLCGYGTIIPNCVLPQNTKFKYNPLSTKALYIGRIDTDKLKSLRSFVEICRKNKFTFDIVGTFAEGEPQFYKETLPKECLLGIIDTRKYLFENSHNYAFIAGVGQVILEASVANLPALIAAHTVPEESYFLTKSNIDISLSKNCVMRESGTIESNIKDFFKSLEVARESNSPDILFDFFTRSEILEKRGPDSTLNHYYQILLGKKNN